MSPGDEMMQDAARRSGRCRAPAALSLVSPDQEGQKQHNNGREERIQLSDPEGEARHPTLSWPRGIEA